MAHRRNKRYLRGCRRAGNDFFVEPPEIFHRSATSGHDQKVRPWQSPPRMQSVKPGDGTRNLGRASRALHRNRPDQNFARKPVAQPMKNVTNDRSGRRSYDADDSRKIRQRFFARRIKQTFGSKLHTYTIVDAINDKKVLQDAIEEVRLITGQQPQTIAAHILSDAHAMTDVTGFGLAGHLHGICEMSGTGAEIDLAAVPAMDGAEMLANQGIKSTLFAENFALVPGLSHGGKADLLFDPQTAGGLLAAVDPDKAGTYLSELKAKGYDAAYIGTLNDQAGRVTLSDN